MKIMSLQNVQELYYLVLVIKAIIIWDSELLSVKTMNGNLL